MMKFWAWLKEHLGQKTTIVGLSAIGGAAMGAVNGELTWQAAVPLIVGGVVAMVLPENPTAQTAIVSAATNIVNAEQSIVQPAAGSTTTINTPVAAVGDKT